MREGLTEPAAGPLIIDGSQGEGGGQILRTSLALSVITGRPIRIEQIRARRAKPGLQRQHLACVEAAAAICGAELHGARLHSQTIEMTPPAPLATAAGAAAAAAAAGAAAAGRREAGAARPGSYHFSIGTAGSTMLVLQTVLPPLLVADGPSEVVIEGGTHNAMSPPFEFIARCFAPVLERMGARVEIELAQVGFNPEGGGRVIARVEPPPAGRLAPIELVEAGPIVRRRATALLSRLPTQVGERELGAVRDALGWHARECAIEDVRAAGPGNVLLLEVERRAGGVSTVELTTGFGEKGTRAERVAQLAIDAMRDYLAAEVPVGEHLADQLMIPFALAAGGRYRTLPLSLHATTNLDVIQRFLPVAIAVAPVRGGGVEVSFAPATSA